jgi:hypothetical protein
MSPSRPYDPFQTFLTVLVIIGLGSVIYSNVLRGEFISDDYITIVDNPAVRDPGDIPRIFQAFNTRFLVGLSFAWNYALSGIDVVSYHVVNIAVHLVNSFLVYILLLTLFKTPVLQNNFPWNRAQDIAFFAGLIFLCHPIQTQGVSYITQRAVSMGTLFYLLTLIFYLKARVDKNRVSYCTAGLAFLTGTGMLCFWAYSISCSRDRPHSRAGAMTWRSGASAAYVSSKRTWSLPLPVQP